MPSLCFLSSLVILAALVGVLGQPTSQREASSQLGSNHEQISLHGSHNQKQEPTPQKAILSTNPPNLEGPSPKSHNLERKKSGVDCKREIDNIVMKSTGYGGGLGGAAVGAALGSIIPGVGTIIGALWGAGAGWLGGAVMGMALTDSSECETWTKH